jgi:hydrogenase expression/formation protein HypE
MYRFLGQEILPSYANDILLRGDDQAILPAFSGEVAFTTDSFVVKPLLFPGGDIGKLAVCGTCNDLAAGGAKPSYLAVAAILEEGLPGDVLRRTLTSVAETARAAGISVVTGDTKVVERGAADGLYLTTTGIGETLYAPPPSCRRVEPGDVILINGPIAEHGLAVMLARENFPISFSVVSDCANLAPLVEHLVAQGVHPKAMRDPTRGGVASALNEISLAAQVEIQIAEDAIPLSEASRGACEMLGFDPLHVANEGKMLFFVAEADAERALDALQGHSLGREASIIGRVTQSHPGRVLLRTRIGTQRILDFPEGELLPRIC